MSSPSQAYQHLITMFSSLRFFTSVKLTADRNPMSWSSMSLASRWKTFVWDCWRVGQNPFWFFFFLFEIWGDGFFKIPLWTKLRPTIRWGRQKTSSSLVSWTCWYNKVDSSNAVLHRCVRAIHTAGLVARLIIGLLYESLLLGTWLQPPRDFSGIDIFGWQSNLN